MRRVYKMGDKRRKIREDALAQLRRTRESIDPSLLAHVRDAIGMTEHHPNSHSDEIPVDRQKMKEIALRLIELTPHRESLRKAILEGLTG